MKIASKDIFRAKVICIAILCVFTLPVSALANGDNYYVKTPANGGSDANNGQSWATAKATIGAAMALVDGSDTIHVAAGTYNEKVTFHGSNYNQLLGGYPAAGEGTQDPWNNTTIIDGTGLSSGSMISIPGDGSYYGYSGIVVDGFTIRNGTLTTWGGAGISSYSLGVSITRNIIEDNQGTGEWSPAGGIYILSQLYDTGTPTIEENIIRNNSAAAVGGIYLEGAAGKSSNYVAYVVNNLIYGNASTDDIGSWSWGVGGVDVIYPASATITNCTIADNTAAHPTAAAAGVHVSGYSGSEKGIIDVANSIIWHPSGDDILVGSDGTFGMTYSDVEDSGDAGGTVISDTPDFVGGSDYHLTADSPCIDTGDNSAASIPTTDFEGDPRIIDGDGDTTATVDMGADEYVPDEEEEMVILHKDGALWSSETGWEMGSPPYYAGSDYARDLEYSSGGNYLILHKDGALYDSGVGWTMTAPPYYAGSNYAVDLEVTATDADCILDRDGALWYSDTGWVLTSPPYYAGSDYARALELRADTSYVILHQYGGLYDSASGWVLTSPPYYPGSAWVVDMKLEAGGYVLLHQDGALWSTSGGWVLTSPPYYAGSDYARALELRADTSYVILHKDGAFYDSSAGWTLTTPPYYSGSDYAVDLEVR